MVASVKRAMAITPLLNRLTYDDGDEIRAVFSDFIGHKVDASFSLIPPFYTTGGENIRVGRNVFINQNCTMYDLGGIDIADDVMIGPNVSIITSGHPMEPSQRRAFVIVKRVVSERNVWIAASATILGGVTVGETSVVAAGAVVTRMFPQIPLSQEIQRRQFVQSPSERPPVLPRLSRGIGLREVDPPWYHV
jgi:acetyltransferase-like isoleucine patch superfamily enzyme